MGTPPCVNNVHQEAVARARVVAAEFGLNSAGGDVLEIFAGESVADSSALLLTGNNEHVLFI